MELKSYLDILGKRKYIVAGVFFALFTIIVIITLLTPPNYVSSVNLRVLTPRSGGMNYISYDIYYANRLMNTYVTMASSTLVLEEVKKNLQLAKLPDVKAEIIPDTELVRISVGNTDPNLAAKIANTLAVELVSRNNEATAIAQNSSEKTLDEQVKKKFDQLSLARKNYNELINPNSQNNSRITTLINKIESNQALYVTLYDRYEVGRQGGIDSSILSSQAAALANLQLQIDDEKASLETLNIKTLDNAEKLRASLREVTLLEQEYSSLITQLDLVRALQTINGVTESSIVVENAVPAARPTTPNYFLVFSIGFVLSLFLAILAAFVFDNLGLDFFSSGKIKPLARIPFLGKIRKFRKEANQEGGVSDGEYACDTQINLRPIIQNKNIKSIVLTGFDKDCNSSIHSINLGREFAESGINTILVDANMESPSVHLFFPEISNSSGIGDVLSGKIKLDKVIRQSGLENLSIIPAGNNKGGIDPSEFKGIVQQLIPRYSMVVVNISPVNANGETEALIGSVDGIILLLNLEKMKKNDFKSLLSRYSDLTPQIAGFLDFQEGSLSSTSSPISESESNAIPIKQFTYKPELELAFSQVAQQPTNED